MQTNGSRALSVILWTFVIVSAAAVMVDVMELNWVKGVILFLAFLSAISAGSARKVGISATPRHPDKPPDEEGNP